MSNLQQLNEAFMALAKATSLDDLIRLAVISLSQELGFDRVGILLYNPASNEQVGTWGTDIKGNLNDEHSFRAPVTDNLIIRLSQHRIELKEDVDLHNFGKVVGRGWHIQSAIFSGNDLFGWLFVDNLIHQQPLKEDQYELLETFSTVLGQLIIRSKIEDTLVESLDSLANKEYLTMDALNTVSKLEKKIDGDSKMVDLAEKVSGLIPASARSVGILHNFISLLSPAQFSNTDQALLEAAKKSASHLSRIFRYVDTKVEEAAETDAQLMKASVIQNYWKAQFNPMFEDTSHQLEICSSNPTETLSFPINLLTQLVKELLTNTLVHGLENEKNGKAMVSISRTKKVLSIAVEDSGVGLDTDQYREVLKMFVTSKPNEKLGSGLNVTQHYVERSLNGQLDLSTSSLGGLCCTLSFPIQDEPTLAVS